MALDLQTLIDKAAEGSTEKQRTSAVAKALEGANRGDLDALLGEVIDKFSALAGTDLGTEDGVLGLEYLVAVAVAAKSVQEAADKHVDEIRARRAELAAKVLGDTTADTDSADADQGVEDAAKPAVVIPAAADVSCYAGAQNLDYTGLVAAGGWCDPSEMICDLVDLLAGRKTGLLSVPEIQAKRGGIRTAMNLGFAKVWAGNAGLIQTDVQANETPVLTPPVDAPDEQPVAPQVTDLSGLTDTDLLELMQDANRVGDDELYDAAVAEWDARAARPDDPGIADDPEPVPAGGGQFDDLDDTELLAVMNDAINADDDDLYRAAAAEWARREGLTSAGRRHVRNVSYWSRRFGRPAVKGEPLDGIDHRTPRRRMGTRRLADIQTVGDKRAHRSSPHPHKLRPWSSQRRADEQERALPDYRGEPLAQHEVEAVKRLQRLGHQVEWLPLGEWEYNDDGRRTGRTPSNDMIWQQDAESEAIHVEVKSTKNTAYAMHGAIRKAVKSAREKHDPPFIKDRFIIDIGPAELTSELERAMSMYNVAQAPNPSNRIKDLWVLHSDGKIRKITLA
ncbi:hypothetical protein GII33_20700 [Gordonia pseudamarae]|uniref:Protein NO VEIN C-terminal domain-containing protein n=1 Tax=Gordonia pseudamarae TaxID=2831662 RepID=A0ABX6IP70_9ACTN|nr:hypothetical protein [Gordonia pseudamarae]QHN28031.1 hypothetical protein GII33_20700 [Gordonia pseudamarae]QHN36911.1 hypothetical protein GII31_20430 [Gordonia pseudamarae]